ncbi:amidohydrolase [Vallitalea okinawensis]|uniref:amidohydrolase n=1 Tax=Vallitalea okinawensis TaxID=2078660 RepID=UPI0013005310|nr:amidohydrolase [Vallitalea okinawensis]
MDLILYNAKAVTLNDEQPYAEAVGIRGSKIAIVGSNEEVLQHRNTDTKVMDLLGKSLVPGFNDSHMHLINFANVRRMIPLSDCQSIEEVISLSRVFLKNHPNHSGWIKGRGWKQENFVEKRFLNKYDLDQISTEHPIIMTRACGHVMVVNSKALEIAGINSDTPQPEGGQIDVDHKGEPTGVFREHAIGLIYDFIESPGLDEIKSMIYEVCRLALKDGITSIQTDDFQTFSDSDYDKIIQAYEELKEEGNLPIRIYQQCLLQELNDLKQFLDKGYYTGYGDEYFKIGPLKLLADGSLGARTALLSQPYEDDPSTCGIGVFTQEELDAIVTYAHDNGMQIAIHCIGDEILDRAIKSYEKALQLQPRNNHRHGIVHCQITREDLTSRLIKSNIIAYIQPIFLDSDIPIVEKRIGKDRAKVSYNFKTMMDLGIHTPYGSDCPVEPFNVMKSIFCAVTREDLHGVPKGGWLPDQKVTLMEALHNYTKESAYASFEEHLKGSIEEGLLADLVVLDRDIMNLSNDLLKDVLVDMTIVNGEIKYMRDY